MKMHSVCCSMVALTLAWGLTANAEDKAVKVKFSELPAPVQEAFKKEAGNGRIVSITMEREKNAIEYEAVIQIGGKTREVTVSEDGKWLETEEPVRLEDLPEQVRATIEAQAGGSTILEINKVETSKHATFYEAEFKKDGKEVEVKVAVDGRLLATETEEHGK